LSQRDYAAAPGLRAGLRRTGGQSGFARLR